MAKVYKPYTNPATGKLANKGRVQSYSKKYYNRRRGMYDYYAGAPLDRANVQGTVREQGKRGSLGFTIG